MAEGVLPAGKMARRAAKRTALEKKRRKEQGFSKHPEAELTFATLLPVARIPHHLAALTVICCRFAQRRTGATSKSACLASHGHRGQWRGGGTGARGSFLGAARQP